MIPHSRPTIGKKEQEGVQKTLASSQIAQGEMVKRFEEKFADEIGVAHAAATSSGTSALHLAIKALGIGKGDQVIMPSYVCTALLNAVHYTGAEPVIADINPVSYNLDPGDVRKRMTSATKAVIVPHIFGLPAALDELTVLGVPVIEDCAQSIGSVIQKKKTGSFGILSIFSFYVTKMMTTGEGGMVVSNDKNLIHGIQSYREYDNRDNYEVRYNYKMTDIQAAMGLAQLVRLDSFIRARRSIAETYGLEFKHLDLHLPVKDPGHVYYRFVMNLGTEPFNLIQILLRKGIVAAKPVYKPLHRYLNLKGFTNSESAWQNSISIPIYPSLSEQEVDKIVRGFKESCKEARIG